MPRISEKEILSIAGSFYQAAHIGTTDAWRQVYLQLAKIFSSGVGGFRLFDTEKRSFTSLISTMPPDLAAEFLQYYQYICPITRGVAKLKPGERYNRAEQMSDDDFVNCEAYRRFYSRAGVFHYEYQAFAVEPGLYGGLVFSRSKSQRNFSSNEVLIMSRILPDLQRAFQLYFRVVDTALKNELMSEALDRMSRNMLIVDCDLKVVFANKGAEAMLDQRDGIEVTKGGRLQASFTTEDGLLRKLADSNFGEQSDESGRVLHLARPSGKRPLEMLFTQFSADRSRAIDQQPLALVFVSDPVFKGEPLDKVLGSMYGLTGAESRIASLIAEGEPIKNICHTLEITQNTIRTHLKRIFSKTGTNGQTELIKLILGGTASIQPPPLQ